ncbi:reductase, partial [Paenibacillus sepulcri]|nr:reductase [Paenibacillus sepulcri]
DSRVEQLGAQRMTSLVECDTDYQERAELWINAVAGTLSQYASREIESGFSANRELSPASFNLPQQQAIETAAAVETVIPGSYDRSHPLHTRLIANRLLNQEASEKETRHYIFDLANTGLHYEAGDALGVWPTNCPDTVEEILHAVELQPTDIVTLKDHGEITVAEALLRHFEIARITPTILQFVQERSHSDQLETLLKHESKSRLKEWLRGRHLVDLLQEFPVTAGADELVRILKPLQPRFYSISSSPMANPDEVHITVSTVRYPFNGKTRKGVCSSFLADRAELAAEVPIFIQKTAHFRLPVNPDTPIIMVGPGTGVGPFRGFLQERQAIRAKGKNWLLFGEQRADQDFYFQEELEAMQRDGILTRLDTAFSRDQPEKIYVQHRLIEHGSEVWAWLREGAHFYIC